jgi:hypothetical protein
LLRDACSDKSINAGSFRPYVGQYLVPTLRPRDIGMTAILSSHNDPAIRRAICAASIKGPDLAPIDQAFTKL